jgi:hypothetical protein
LKTALIEKEGNGTTTLAALLVRRLVGSCPVLAVNAETNHDLPGALDAREADTSALPTPAGHLPLTKHWGQSVDRRGAGDSQDHPAGCRVCPQSPCVGFYRTSVP